MNVAIVGHRKFCGPAGWHELRPPQFRQYLNFLSSANLPADAGTQSAAGKFALLQLWYGIRYVHLRGLTDEQRADLLALLDFLDQRPERWMLPHLWVEGRVYAGPGDGLESLTFGEFMHAQAALERYQTGAGPDLTGLVAALYRPVARFWHRAGDGGRRVFDRRLLDRQARSMRSISLSVQQGVLLNFLGCIDGFPTQFEHLYKPRTSQSEDQSDGTWLDVGINLARQTGALGTFADIERTNLFLVLTTLDAIVRENTELEDRMKRG